MKWVRLRLCFGSALANPWVLLRQLPSPLQKGETNMEIKMSIRIKISSEVVGLVTALINWFN
jgi:hypothetical protein